ncbi:MAG TPA: hypothetical protein DCE23_08875 [Firmicutes bacterium]|nr:hypothetical protein [Bacillota bacterium]
MIIPCFLRDGDIIGITACSCGVLKKIDKFEKTLVNLKKNSFNVIETDNVRKGGDVSSSAIVRARELESLFLNKNVKMVAVARGGDYLFDMLDIIDFSILANNHKWLAGSSDPTSLLYILTTNYDIATIYSPCNMTGLDEEVLHDSYLNYFKILKGNLIKQYKYDKCEKESFSDDLSKNNEWININGDVNQEGILIGGCLDVLKDLIGTRFDKTNQFIEKYRSEGLIWYFDVFDKSNVDLYNTLLQFKYAGWFKYAKAVLIGKVCIANSFGEASYEELIKKALGDIPVIYKFDVGHVKPSFTMINGMKVRVISNKFEGSLEYIN